MHSLVTIKITRVVNLPLEFWTVGCRKRITWWPKEVVTWLKKVVMWFMWNGLTVMAFNKEGWFYEGGKGPSEELKEQIIDKILETGGDGILGYFPAKWTKLGDKFGVSDHGKPSLVNPPFRSPLQARGGIFSDHVTLFFKSHDHNRTASDSNFQRQFYHSTGFDSN